MITNGMFLGGIQLQLTQPFSEGPTSATANIFQRTNIK